MSARLLRPFGLLLSVALIASCASASARSRSSALADGHVTVVGDSLTLLGSHEIEDTLSGSGWLVTIAGYPGRTTEAGSEALRVAAGLHNQATVVELGTNDALGLAHGRLTVEQVHEAIRSNLDRFSSDQCVVWIIPDRDPERHGAERGADIATMVRDDASQHPNVHIADMGDVLAAHPEYFADDHVHLTSPGSSALAELMATNLAACK